MTYEIGAILMVDSIETTGETGLINKETSELTYDELKAENQKLKKALQSLSTVKNNDANSFWLAALDKSEGTELINDLRSLCKDLLEYSKSSTKSQMLHSFYQTAMTTLFLGIIIGAALYLTTRGFLDGSSTTFLIGTITGYYITYLTRREAA